MIVSITQKTALLAALLALAWSAPTLAKETHLKNARGSLIYTNMVTLSGNFNAYQGMKHTSYPFRGALQNVSDKNFPDQLHRLDYVDNNNTELDPTTKRPIDKLIYNRSLSIQDIQNGGDLFSLAGIQVISITGPKMSPKEGAMTLKVRQNFRNLFSNKKSSIQIYYNHGDSVSQSKVQYFNPRTKKWHRINHLHINLASPGAVVPSGLESVRLQLRDKKGTILETETFFASELQ